MATHLVTPAAYPDLDALELTSARGGTVRFVGRACLPPQACPSRGGSATITVYRGPQHGLALDTERQPVDVEIGWCSGHGLAKITLRNTDGGQHRADR